jgi:SAM-dependent methyltransferase
MQAVRDYLEVLPGQSVLDYGCGTGRFSEFLPDHAHYIGVDSSQAMLDRAIREHPDTTEGPHLKTWFLGGRMLGLLRVSHAVAIGIWNEPGDTDPWDTVADLWSLVTKTLVVSLHRDLFPIENIVAELHRFGLTTRGRMAIDGTHYDNDWLLVLKK